MTVAITGCPQAHKEFEPLYSRVNALILKEVFGVLPSRHATPRLDTRATPRGMCSPNHFRSRPNLQQERYLAFLDQNLKTLELAH
jgi:hypothetical protein